MGNKPATGAKLPVVPGELRKNHVQVGLHIPPDPDDIENFLKRFVEAHQSKHLHGCAGSSPALQHTTGWTDTPLP
ncbi:hypothetical protein [Mesorhizobium australafricanum]|uniref:Uncharacterized protein n=1 Tax=Mesorhizobium australafricanum TaxID=3072311 RepID=A0ABU4X6F7_9HYPH|nr:hypothetical protein [Mesorhizobium sp. VK3E]MDX8443078.1 hypothetical protein [Mesorhizobium sp. VK3E]